MARIQLSTQDDRWSSGMAVSDLQSLTWDQITSYETWRQGMLARDMDAQDVRIEVRVLPEVLKAIQKRRGVALQDEITVDLAGPVRAVVGPDWKSVRASVALQLYRRMYEDATLGASYVETVHRADGHGGKEIIEQLRQGTPLFEFRTIAS